jgi:preprotein translocase SecE subunit
VTLKSKTNVIFLVTTRKPKSADNTKHNTSSNKMSFVLRASSSSLASPSTRQSTLRNSTKTTKSIIRSTSSSSYSARRTRRHHHQNHRAFLVVRATSGEDDEGAEGGGGEGTDSEVIEAEFTGEEDARKEERTSTSKQEQEQTPGDLLRSQKEAKADEGINIFAGASEEVGLIEWPTAGKAAQTTGVVIVGIVFSAVFLLVVNEVLSTLSGKIFN